MVSRAGRRDDDRHGDMQPRLLSGRRDLYCMQHRQLLPGRSGIAHLPVRRRNVVRWWRDVDGGLLLRPVRPRLLPLEPQQHRDLEPLLGWLLLPRGDCECRAISLQCGLLLSRRHGERDGESLCRGHVVRGRLRVCERSELQRLQRGLLHGVGESFCDGEPVRRWYVLRRVRGLAHGPHLPRGILLFARNGRLHGLAVPRGHVQYGRRRGRVCVRRVQRRLLHRPGLVYGDVQPLRRGLLLPDLCDLPALPPWVLLPCRHVSHHLPRRHSTERVACLRSWHLLRRRLHGHRAVVVRLLSPGLLPRHCECDDRRQPLRGRLLLRRLDAGEFSAKRLPCWILLLERPIVGDDEPVPRWHVLAGRDDVHVPRIVLPLRGGLLPRPRQHHVPVEPLHGWLLLRISHYQHHAEPVCGWLLLRDGHRVRNADNALRLGHVVERRHCLHKRRVVHCMLTRLLPRERQRDGDGEPLRCGLLLRHFDGGERDAGTVQRWLLLPRRLERPHRVPRGLLLWCCGRGCVHGVLTGLVSRDGQHCANVEPLQRGLLLRFVQCRQHAAGRVPDRLLLPGRLCQRHPVPGRLLRRGHGPPNEHVHGRVHSRLLRDGRKHVDNGEPVHCRLLLSSGT